MRKIYFLVLLCLVLLGISESARAQAAAGRVSGTVLTAAGNPLPGATIFIRGTFIGTSTNRDGLFELAADFGSGPVTLSVSFVGYVTREVTLAQPDNSLQVQLLPNPTQSTEVVVSASRVEENILRVPVTVEKVTSQQVMRLAPPDVQVGLNHFKGIDVNGTSMLINSMSTRGFNSPKSERLIQLTDYFDTQSPSLNINSGNLTGLPEIDIESIEIIHGPASALYGANAFNGVLLQNSKDPFVSEGLSVRVRGGSRSLFDGQLRYAQRISDRLAFKVTGAYLVANDWLAENYAATSSRVEQRNNAQGSSLGYEAVNRYGDVDFTVPANYPFAELRGKKLYMPGFTEQSLIGNDDHARSLKVHPSLAYLLTDAVKVTVGANFNRGTASYQSSSRYRFKNFGTNQFHGEVKGTRWFVRGQSVQDFGADSYDLNLLGAFIQNAPANGTNGPSFAERYFKTYLNEYATGRLLGQPDADALQRAQQAVSQPGFQLEPGSASFNSLRSELINNATPGRGAGLKPSSLLNEGTAQYNFQLATTTDLIVGGAYRKFRLGSNGNLFSDDEERIQNHEIGGYAQLTQKLADDRLKLALAGRIDGFKNFDAAFSPRASAVYSAGATRQHNFRASYGRAFRSPTQLDQSIRLDLRRVLLLGNVGNGFQGYRIGANDRPGTEFNADPLRLERLSTVEVGYKGIFIEKLAVDVNYYRSSYNDFIGAVRFFGNRDGSRPTPAQLATEAGRQTPETPFQQPDSPTRVLQVWTNADQEVRTQGAALSLTYAFAPAFNLAANYTLNVQDKIDQQQTDFQTYFNTPQHKFNIGASGVVRNGLSYALNYRWAQGHEYGTPFAVGQLASYSSTDAYLGYAIPKLGLTLQGGGSNVFDANNVQVYGGPQIGRLLYVGLQFDVK